MDHLYRSNTAPVKTSSDRAFGWVFTAFFSLVGLWPLVHGHAPRTWALILAAIFAAATIIRPVWLAPLNRLWTRFGLFLHKIVNPLVLGLIYVLAILPFGLLFQAMGKDPLRLKRHANVSSYWIARQPPGPSADSLPRQF